MTKVCVYVTVFEARVDGIHDDDVYVNGPHDPQLQHESRVSGPPLSSPVSVDSRGSPRFEGGNSRVAGIVRVPLED